MIQALIRRSVPNPDEPFVETLTRRVCSISRSQDILLQGAWIGASISDLLMTQTAVSGDSAGHQTVFRGDPTLRLLPDAAERLGLAIHELTTNAIKYGALSTLSGTVTIEWGITDTSDKETFFLRWTETGGPSVIPPARRGFGSIVIEHNPRTLRGGKVHYDLKKDGVMWEFQAPATSVLRLKSDEKSTCLSPADVKA